MSETKLPLIIESLETGSHYYHCCISAGFLRPVCAFIAQFVDACVCVCCSFIHKTNVEFKSATFPNAGSRHLLDDSVLESHTPARGQTESSTLSSGISLGKHTYIHTHTDSDTFYILFDSILQVKFPQESHFRQLLISIWMYSFHSEKAT